LSVPIVDGAPTSPARALRVGLIGLGLIGRRHAATLQSLDGAALVATADPHAAADHADWRALLDAGPLDAVLVCTPPDAHRDPAVAALARGIPLYLEKPIAHDAADAAAIVAAAAAAGVPCAVGYQYRALSFLGALPTDSAMLVGVGISETAPRAWLGDRSRGGSHLLERASHLVDLVHALAGRAAAVRASDRGDRLVLTLELASGALAALAVARVPGGPGWRLELVGPRGTTTVALDEPPHADGPGGPLRHEGRPLLERSLARFLDAVRTGDPAAVCCTPAAAAETLATALACLEAARAPGRQVGAHR
jgi:myo-inositol 2-dehydrogenase / D-chiro-inositol 1-dehydrogenase